MHPTEGARKGERPSEDVPPPPDKSSQPTNDGLETNEETVLEPDVPDAAEEVMVVSSRLWSGPRPGM